MFLTIYMHQFEWLSERGDNVLNLLQKEGVPRKSGGSLRKGGRSNPRGNYVITWKNYRLAYGSWPALCCWLDRAYFEEKKQLVSSCLSCLCFEVIHLYRLPVSIKWLRKSKCWLQSKNENFTWTLSSTKISSWSSAFPLIHKRFANVY